MEDSQPLDKGQQMPLPPYRAEQVARRIASGMERARFIDRGNRPDSEHFEGELPKIAVNSAPETLSTNYQLPNTATERSHNAT